MCVTNCADICAHCGGQLPQCRRGRRRRYCSNGCRQRAYRRRRAGLVEVMRAAGMGSYARLRWSDYRKPYPYETVTKWQKLVEAAASTG